MKNKTLIITIAAAFIAGIIFTGAAGIAFKRAMPFVTKVFTKLKERKIANIPKAKDTITICGFEDDRDVAKWDFVNAAGEIVSEHASAGKSALKVTFHPSSGASAAKIEKYFERNKSIKDWSRYEIMSFDIFNPGSRAERAILQIRDSRDRKVKMNLQIDPNASTPVEVDIAQLWASLNPQDIEQVNLFLWGNKAEKTLYIDNVQLLPAAALEKQYKDILAPEFLPKPGEPIYATGDYFAFDRSKWLAVPLTIKNYSAFDLKGLPVSGGVPFPKGEVESLDKIEVFDETGAAMPFQANVAARWPDKSIKWALITLRADLAPREIKNLNLKYGGAGAGIVPGKPLEIEDSVRSLFGAQLVLVHKGKEYYGRLDKDCDVTIEESGPERASIKAEGWYVSAKGEKFCKFIVRIYAFAGSKVVKAQHTLIYTGYPENKQHYLYKGKRLPKNETIDAFYLRWPYSVPDNATFTFGTDAEVIQGLLGGRVELTQKASDKYDLFESGKLVKSGRRLNGWLDVSGPDGGMTIGVKNLWQQFPKAFVVDKDNRCVELHLWPKSAGALDLKTTAAANGPDAVARGSAFGLAKTHDIFIYPHKAGYDESLAENVAEGLLSDILIAPDPAWTAATRVLGRVSAYDKRNASGEAFLSLIFDWGSRQIDAFTWYGMVDFGDTLSWYRNEDGAWGWFPVGRHGWFNCEGVGTHAGALMQFLRTGERKYLVFGSNLARHIMDIDTCHYNTVANDRRLKGVIPDDYSQPGSIHRHNGDHWGGRNEETSHTNAYGLALYYYITGDERARDILAEVGDFFLKERMTYFQHPDIAPQRSLANVLWGDMTLYEMTGDERYRKQADRLANLFYRGQKRDGAWSENYNPVKKRWDGKNATHYMNGYTMPALIEYHKLTGNKAIAESVVKATDYLIKTEGYAAYFPSSAYSYYLTGNNKYRDNIAKRLDFSVKHQNKNEDPLWKGMIYQKGYYARVYEYLYNVPFAFEALAGEGKQ